MPPHGGLVGAAVALDEVDGIGVSGLVPDLVVGDVASGFVPDVIAVVSLPSLPEIVCSLLGLLL